MGLRDEVDMGGCGRSRWGYVKGWDEVGAVDGAKCWDGIWGGVSNEEMMYIFSPGSESYGDMVCEVMKGRENVCQTRKKS